MPERGVKRAVAWNTAIQVAAHAVGLVSAFAMSYVLARHLGVERFGEFHYIFAFYYFFQVLNDFGIQTIAVRELAARPEERPRIAGSVFVFRFLVSILTAAIACAAILNLGYPREMTHALLIYAAFLPLGALQFPASIFQVLLDLRLPVTVGIFSKILSLALVMFAVSRGGGLPAIIALLVISEIVYTAILFVSAMKKIKPVFGLDREILLPLLRASFFQGATGLLVACVNRMDFLMLERMKGLADVGYYATCYRITNLVESLPVMAMATIYPVMAGARGDMTRLRRIFFQVTAMFSGAGVAAAVLICLMADWIIAFIFGSEYLPSVPALRVLVWSSAFIYSAIAAGNLLISLGREKVNFGIYVAAAAVNFACNLVWIPRYGFIGAASATLVTFGFVFLASISLAACYLRAAGIKPIN